MKKLLLSCLAIALATSTTTGCVKKLKNKEISLTPTKLVDKTKTTTADIAPKATAFSTSISDTRSLNVTQVVRPTGEIAQKIQQAIDNTNKLRAEKGLKPLKIDDNLMAYAQMRASEIPVTSFGHTRPNGEDALDSVKGGWRGENVAGGHATADETVLKQWRNSQGHYANIINPNYETIGIGLVYDPNSKYGYYWVQIFGSSATTTPYQFIDASSQNPLSQVKSTPISLTAKGHWHQFTEQNTQGYVAGYDNSRFGLVGQELFYQGNQTADIAIPKTGTATYTGTGLIVKNGTVDTNIQSQFTADFGARKLNGALKQNNSTLYNLNADINGSGFASKAGASVETTGAFFGNNAEELSGVFKDTKSDTKGVFGASK